MLVLLALALLLAPFHGHGSGDGTAADHGSRVIALDAGGPTPEPQPEHPDHKSGPCGACMVIKHSVPPRISDALVIPVVGGLRFWPLARDSAVAAAPTDLFRPPIRAAA